jgi:hypothetical protein
MAMRPHTSLLACLEPRRRVIVINDGTMSGDVLGCIGTIVRVDVQSVVRNRRDSNRRKYLVFSTRTRCCVGVARKHLVAIGGFDHDPLPISPRNMVNAYRFFFDRRTRDGDEIDGHYLLPGRDWDCFRLRRCDIADVDFQLRMPVVNGRGQRALLDCRVPFWAKFNREYVRAILNGVVGRHLWCEVRGS